MLLKSKRAFKSVNSAWLRAVKISSQISHLIFNRITLTNSLGNSIIILLLLLSQMRTNRSPANLLLFVVRTPTSKEAQRCFKRKTLFWMSLILKLHKFVFHYKWMKIYYHNRQEVVLRLRSKKYKKKVSLSPIHSRLQLKRRSRALGRSRFKTSILLKSLDKEPLVKFTWLVTSIKKILRLRSKNCQKTSWSGLKRFKAYLGKKTYWSIIGHVLSCQRSTILSVTLRTSILSKNTFHMAPFLSFWKTQTRVMVFHKAWWNFSLHKSF